MGNLPAPRPRYGISSAVDGVAVEADLFSKAHCCLAQSSRRKLSKHVLSWPLMRARSMPGTAMVERRPMMETTIMISVSVKPNCFLNFALKFTYSSEQFTGTAVLIRNQLSNQLATLADGFCSHKLLLQSGLCDVKSENPTLTNRQRRSFAYVLRILPGRTAVRRAAVVCAGIGRAAACALQAAVAGGAAAPLLVQVALAGIRLLIDVPCGHRIHRIRILRASRFVHRAIVVIGVVVAIAIVHASDHRRGAQD
jgi:hypothetical protein